jgi:hypothetical protein
MVALVDESTAVGLTGVMAVPVTVVGEAGAVTTSTLVTVQVNEAEPLKPDESTAVTVAVQAQAAVGVPESVPVEASMAMPAGRPVAE